VGSNQNDSRVYLPLTDGNKAIQAAKSK
jgi:hypothetical protein